MTEFEAMRKALERVYDEVEVDEWDFDNSALITVNFLKSLFTIGLRMANLKALKMI